MITFTIDEKKYPMLEIINKKNINKVLNNIFETGYNVLYPKRDTCDNKDNDIIINSMNHHTDSIKYDIHTIKSQINNMDIGDKFEKLTDVLEELLGINENSCKKGRLSESVIFKMVKNRFKDYTVHETRNIPHSGDAIINLNSDNHNEKIMLEIKNYSRTVDKDEIEKLKKDMRYMKIRYSIMISLRSGFVRQKQMTIQEFQYLGTKYYILFLPNLFGQLDKIEASVLLVERLIELDKNINDKSVNIDKISDHLRELDNIYTDFNIVKHNFFELEKNIKKQLFNFYENLRDYEIKVRDRINTVWNDIKKDMHKDIIPVDSMPLEGISEGCFKKRLVSIFNILKKHKYSVDQVINSQDMWFINYDNHNAGYIKKAKRNNIIIQIFNPKYYVLINSTVKMKDVLLDLNLTLFG